MSWIGFIHHDGSANDLSSATYLGWMSSVTYVVALLGPALAAASMTVWLWLPFWLGAALLLLAIPAISRLPDHTSAGRSSITRFQRRDPTDPLPSSPILKAQGSEATTTQAVIDRLKMLRAILASRPRNLTLLFVCFFLSSLASSDTKLLPQYISKRYRWSFASAGYLLSGKAVVNFTLLTLVIPWLLRSRHSGIRDSSEYAAMSDSVNIRHAIICWIVSVLGAFFIALAAEVWALIPALFLYALGSALPVFTLSLLKSPAVAPTQDRRFTKVADPETHIFSMVMMVKALGSLLGAPLMAALWVHGIRAGGVALGSPYFVSSACYMLAIVVFTGFRPSRE